MAKFYVVWHGRKTGIYNTWEECKAQVDGISGARFKSFGSKQEAEAEFAKENPSRLFKSNTDTVVTKNYKSQKTVKLRQTATQKTVDIDLSRADVSVFSDGGCLKNPGGDAGSGIAVYRKGVLDELWYGMYLPEGTNNIAELNALYKALVVAKESLAANQSSQVFTDSKYSLQAVTQWANNWKKNGWRTKTGPVKNQELVEKCFDLYLSLNSKVKVYYVPGHTDVEGNELADRMATLAIRRCEVEFIHYTEYKTVAEVLSVNWTPKILEP